MNNILINETTQPIKQWVDQLEPNIQMWLKDYMVSKFNPTVISGVPQKNYYFFDYRYASEYPTLTSTQTDQLKDIGAEIMFIYDTIRHRPVQIKPISGSPEANQIASNQGFWGELMKGYVAGLQGKYEIKSIIGPASGGLMVYAPPNKEHEVFRILSTIEGNDCMAGIDNVEHQTIAGHKVIHVSVDAMG